MFGRKLGNRSLVVSREENSAESEYNRMLISRPNHRILPKGFLPIMQKQFITALIYSSLSFLIFWLIFHRNISTDLQLHIELLQFHLEESSFPAPPLYYGTVYVSSWLFLKSDLIYASIIVLGIACFFKYWAVHHYLSSTTQKNTWRLSLLCFALMIFHPVIFPFLTTNHYYLGKFSSNIWHNSTTIFVFPFCVWLFTKSSNYLRQPSVRGAVFILVPALLILLAKPSFLFPFIFAFPAICWYTKMGRKFILISIAISAVIASMILIQKNIIYQHEAFDKYYGYQSSEVIIWPFRVWLHFTDNPLRDVFASFLFLFTYVALRFKVLIRDTDFLYAGLLLSGSMMIALIFAESGPRLYHGNFFWQVPISILIMNMVLGKDLLASGRISSTNFDRSSLKTLLLIGIMLLHVLSGIVYVVRLVIDRTYL